MSCLSFILRKTLMFDYNHRKQTLPVKHQYSTINALTNGVTEIKHIVWNNYNTWLCLHTLLSLNQHSIISGCKFLSWKYYRYISPYDIGCINTMYIVPICCCSIATIYYENKSMSKTIVHIPNWPHLGQALMCVTNSTCLLSLGTELYRAPSTPYCTWLLHHPQIPR